MIISDATILITLIQIDEFKVLKFFTKKIIIPLEVYHEVSKKIIAKKFLDSEIKDGFIKIENYKDKTLFKEINFLLDKGESASITLAIEKNLPLIIDEKKGRRFAKSQGVETIGLIGILRFLYMESLFKKDEITLIIDKLNNSYFRISQELLDMILKS